MLLWMSETNAIALSHGGSRRRAQRRAGLAHVSRSLGRRVRVEEHRAAGVHERASPLEGHDADRDGEVQRAIQPTHPNAPQYSPRRTGSSASMTSSARTFGAPVTEPGGRRRSRGRPVAPGARGAPRRSRPCGARRATTAGGRASTTRTLRARPTRPRSLRTRSTIMASSAASFGSRAARRAARGRRRVARAGACP